MPHLRYLLKKRKTTAKRIHRIPSDAKNVIFGIIQSKNPHLKCSCIQSNIAKSIFRIIGSFPFSAK